MGQLINVRVYDPSLNLLKELSNFISLQFTERAENIGEFELHTNSALPCFEKGNFIRIGRDASMSGVIEYTYDNTDGMNPDEAPDFCIKGYSLMSLVAQRVTVPAADGDGYTHYKKKPAEDVIYDLVDKHVVNPTDTKRKMSLFSTDTNQHRGTAITMDTRYDNVVEQITSACSQSDLSVRINLDAVNKRLVFQVYEGTDRTTGQNRYLFSKRFDRLSERTIEVSSMGTSNMAYVLGEGDGADRKTVKVNDEAAGMDRRELYVDARDISNTKDDDTSYNAEESLKARGEEKLDEVKETSAFNFTAKPDDYNTKFFLGDECVFYDDPTGTTQTGKLTEVAHVWEGGAHTLTVTIGHQTTDILSAITSAASDAKVERSGISQEFKTVKADLVEANKVIATKVDTTDFDAVTVKVADGSGTVTRIDGGKIQAASLSVISANAGVLTAGTLKSEDYVQDETGMCIDLDDGTVDSKFFKIASDGTVTIRASLYAEDIINGKLSGNQIEANAITAESGIIADGAITNAKIQDAAIDSAKIKSLSGDLIQTGTIDGDLAVFKNMRADSITVGKINGYQIEDGTISSNLIADASVDVDKIADGAITAEKTDIKELSEITDGNLGVCTAGVIQSPDGNLKIDLNDEKAISVTSSEKNTTLKIDADGTRVVSNQTGKVVAQFTESGTETNVLTSNKAVMAGMLVERVGSAVWISVI